ncbi:hypothetical protein ACFFON_01395 [Arthrobacter citreus]|uniref:hypothetical protein n=1 Tax=Arthrobacter TaxID=1663 RepID=UPI0014797A54|nr:hypothetical protein [Arthrobacter gandavensis]
MKRKPGTAALLVAALLILAWNTPIPPVVAGPAGVALFLAAFVLVVVRSFQRVRRDQTR